MRKLVGRAVASAVLATAALVPLSGIAAAAAPTHTPVQPVTRAADSDRGHHGWEHHGRGHHGWGHHGWDGYGHRWHHGIGLGLGLGLGLVL